MADTQFTATAQSIEGLQVRASSRQHTITVDEPAALGGTDLGANPVELLLAALGSCQVIVARAYAEARGINLRDVAIDVTGTLDPDGFLGKNPDAKLGFSAITSRFRIDAENTQEEIEQFVEFIEATCPVLDTLVNTPRIAAEVAPAGEGKGTASA
ncbi:OsmC family protein [Helcobacillus sp. ACRRO]|uniref:OsmC family protein n=1 Tax=Helcobacillus sp. ACRRO TaxID=2918202 RepID=UPI001EF6857D|nr:OsmC family protein [Helcobacillus sp. ACRRO]MCG7426247.1 OsmC family protein [Helcobacillus sp. ACRRO]